MIVLWTSLAWGAEVPADRLHEVVDYTLVGIATARPGPDMGFTLAFPEGYSVPVLGIDNRSTAILEVDLRRGAWSPGDDGSSQELSPGRDGHWPHPVVVPAGAQWSGVVMPVGMAHYAFGPTYQRFTTPDSRFTTTFSVNGTYVTQTWQVTRDPQRVRLVLADEARRAEEAALRVRERARKDATDAWERSALAWDRRQGTLVEMEQAGRQSRSIGLTMALVAGAPLLLGGAALYPRSVAWGVLAMAWGGGFVVGGLGLAVQAGRAARDARKGLSALPDRPAPPDGYVEAE